MRASLLVLAACSHAASRPAVEPSPPTKQAAASTPVAPRAGRTWARVAVDPDGWIDIVIEGDGRTAREACEQFVGYELVIRPGAHARVMRACLSEPLPRIGSGASVLVTTERIDENTLVTDILHIDRAPTGPAIRGVVSDYQPFIDDRACESARIQLAIDGDREWFELEHQRIAAIDERLPAAAAQEKDSCTRYEELSARCKGLAGARAKDCVLEAELQRTVCEEMQRRRAQLEQQRAVRPRKRSRSHSCIAGH